MNAGKVVHEEAMELGLPTAFLDCSGDAELNFVMGFGDDRPAVWLSITISEGQPILVLKAYNADMKPGELAELPVLDEQVRAFTIYD